MKICSCFVVLRFKLKSLRNKIRNSLRKRRLGIGADVSFGSGIRIIGDGILCLSDKVRIEDYCSFCFNPIDGNSPKIVIGTGSLIGKGNDFGCSHSIIIGNYVITAPYVHYTDRNHCFEDIETPIMKQASFVKGPIKIGDGSWIGFGAQIMSGVSIGRHCIVGAGAIVTKDVPDYCVAVGNPAKIIKRYNFNTLKWEKV